ncbi:MAG: FadR/GntR family transcriptional regulator [Atribacterota bacterium]|nr:FadR/GntR family transcriptional regulator [Atribacterota bacterium]
MFNKIKTQKVYVKIVEQIRELIREGKLKPGDRLPSEQELAEQFGISRPSVREAMSALEILGITERRVGKGNFIKDNSLSSTFYEEEILELEQEESPFELLEARKVLETELAGLASQKGSPEDIAAIETALSNMRDALGNIPRMMEMDREFHINIAKAAHNSLLFSVMLNMSDLLKERLWVNMKEKTWNLPDYPQKYIKEHSAILEAIKSKDEKSARKAMYFHLAGVEEDILKE